MPIDATIPLSFRPTVELQNPLQMLGQRLQVQGAQQQNSLLQMKMEDMARARADQNSLRADLAAPDADPYKAFIRRGMVDEATKYQAGQRANDKANIDLLDAKLKQSRQFLDSVTTPEQYLQWHQANHADPIIGPALAARGVTQDQAAASIQQALAQPGGFEQLLAKSRMGLDKFMELNAPKTVVVPTGGMSQVLQTPGLGGPPRLVANFTHTQTPDSIASNARIAAEGAANRAQSAQVHRDTLAKDYRVAGLNPDGTDPNGTVGGLTPEAIDNAAKRYNFDGTLPPSIGRGTQGARDLRAIQNRAAELNHAAPDDASGGRAGQMANKADAASLAQLTKQQQMASSFERTANANADLALGLSKKIDRTGVPIVNAGLQAWRTGTGSPEATQFAAANETFVNEYAKIMSGGMGSGPVTDSARSKARTLLTTSMTPQQYEGNVRLLQTEMQNRMKGYHDQANEITSRMRGGAQPAGGSPASGVRAPAVGTVQGGYRFKGGDPADPHSWEKH